LDDGTEFLIEKFSSMTLGNKKTMKASECKKRLVQKHEEKIKSIKSDVCGPSRTPVKNDTESMFNKCVEYYLTFVFGRIETIIIGDKYDIDFYIEELYKFLSKFAEKLTKKYGKFTSDEQEEEVFIEEYSKNKEEFEKIRIEVMKYLVETDYIPNYFSKLLGKKIETLEDYDTIDKIACDFHNYFMFILNVLVVAEQNDEGTEPFNEPVFVDKYDYKIVEGIKITLNGNAIPMQVKALDKRGREVELENKEEFCACDPKGNLLIIGKILEMNNIHELEIFCIDQELGFNVERIKVGKIFGF
jgi:hypothetical protein